MVKREGAHDKRAWFWLLVPAAVGATAAAAILGVGASSPTNRQLSLVPNMSGFLSPTYKNYCYNGNPENNGYRPCAPLIRVIPHLSGDIINANPSQTTRVIWPLEAFGGHGDAVGIRCYTPNGQDIAPYEGSGQSTDWYEVEVPRQYVLNPKVETELSGPNSPIRSISKDGQTFVLGWASVEWFHQTTASAGVSVCAP